MKILRFNNLFINKFFILSICIHTLLFINFKSKKFLGDINLTNNKSIPISINIKASPKIDNFEAIERNKVINKNNSKFKKNIKPIKKTTVHKKEIKKQNIIKNKSVIEENKSTTKIVKQNISKKIIEPKIEKKTIEIKEMKKIKETEYTNKIKNGKVKTNQNIIKKNKKEPENTDKTKQNIIKDNKEKNKIISETKSINKKIENITPQVQKIIKSKEEVSPVFKENINKNKLYKNNDNIVKSSNDENFEEKKSTNNTNNNSNLKNIFFNNGNFTINSEGTYTAVSSKGIHFEIIEQVDPIYPKQAKMIRYRKTVKIKVRFLVNLKGKIEDIKITNSHKKFGFDKEVIKALKKWKFKPIIYEGKKIKVYFNKEFIFNSIS